MTEREIQASIIKGGALEKFVLYKLVDAYNGGKKPADIIGITPTGAGILIEVKKTKSAQDKISQALFAYHQKIWLKAYAEANISFAIAAIYLEITGELILIRLEPFSFSTQFIDLSKHRYCFARKHISGAYLGLNELLSFSQWARGV